MDLVVVSLEAWDDVWRRNQHIVSRLLDTDASLRVLFVEPAADPLHDLLSRRTPASAIGVTRVDGYGGRLMRFRPIKLLPRRVDACVDERLARSVHRGVGEAGLSHPVLWLNDPGAAPLARLTGWPTLYDITDDWAAAERRGAEVERIREGEAWLLPHAAAVVACSEELVRRKAPLRTGTIDLIPNAVDVDAYRVPHERPDDLPESSAVYVGTLHRDRLDLELCIRTAQTLGPAGRVVLVGPNALGGADTARLVDAGVVLLGARPRDEVIGYLQHAEVLLVPHLVTPFTESLDPIKLYEYQAVGRPVVSTPVAGFRDAASPRIRIVPAASFPEAARAVLTASMPFPNGSGRPVASWDDRAAAMRAVLDRIG